MANALATLFGDIAAAIKAKNGEEGVKYKPVEFPGKIMALTVAGAANTGLKYRSGTFTPNTSGGNTITHNMGVVPDVIVIFPCEGGTMSGLLASIGFSQGAMDATKAQPTVWLPNGSSLGYALALTDNTQNHVSLGLPRGATSEIFYVGGGANYNYSSSVKYAWIALGNLFHA